MANGGNAAVQQAFVTAVLSGDADTIRALCTPDFVLEQGAGLPYAGFYHGGQGFLDFLGVFAATWQIEQLEPVRNFTCDDPDLIVSEFAMRAKLLRTGAPYESSLLELWTFRDGKVSAIKPHYFNAAPG